MKYFVILGRSNQCAIYSINNSVGLKLHTRLKLGLSHLNEHRFNHNFQICINPLRTCSPWNWINYSFFTALPSLYKHPFNSLKQYSWNYSFIVNTVNVTDAYLVNLLLFHSRKYTEIDNSHIINSSIKYLLDFERFSGPPF